MTLSTQRRLVLAGLLVLALAAGWFLLGRRPAAPVETPRTAATQAPPAAVPLPLATVPPGGSVAAKSVTDFATALDAARRLPGVTERNREFGRLIARWLEQNPDAALAYVRHLPPGAEFTSALLMTLEAIGRGDPDRALALARELAITREQRAIYSALFAQLAQQDVQGAAQRLSLMPPGDAREKAVRALADEWARRDFTAALAWSRQLDPADRAAGLESVIGSLVADDPLRAIQLAQQSLTGAPLDRTLTAALQKLTETDVGAAASIVTLLPPGEVQTFAALDVARALAARDPAAALTWIKTLPAGTPQRLALNNALDSWTASDPAAAGGYVAQMPAGSAQDVAAEHFARVFGARDPARAIAWAEALTSEDTRQTALVTIGSAWAQHEPAAATAWAMTLPVGAVQTGALTGAFSYWLKRDAPAAQTWLAKANLPADVKARLVSTATR